MSDIADVFIGTDVIVRTDRAGVWFGTLSKKAGREVILTHAHRMWTWHARQSISLSAVALYGVDQSKSKIAPAIDAVWLEAIEILHVHGVAALTIVDAPEAKQDT